MLPENSLLTASQVATNSSTSDAARFRRLASYAVLTLPALATLFLGLNGGGYFPTATGTAAAIAALFLAVTLVATRAQRYRASRTLVLGLTGLGIFCIWTLLSAFWSDAPGRTLLELDRALLYLFVAAAFGLATRTSARLRVLLGALGVAFIAIAAIGLATRVAPDLFPTDTTVAHDRLSYPITYWNGFGLVCALGALFCAHFGSDLRSPWPVRIAACGALPVVLVALYFSFSRAGIGVAVVGALLYLALGASAGLPGAVLAALPAVYALHAAYGSPVLSSADPLGSGATAEGHHLATLLGGCVLASALLRLAGLGLDRRLCRWLQARGGLRARWKWSIAAAFILGAGTVGAATNALELIDRGYSGFTSGEKLPAQDQRARLGYVANNGRLHIWRVALDAFSDHPVRGLGAGTFVNEYLRTRRNDEPAVDGHSLILETLAELGIVGILALALAGGAFFVGVIRGMRGAERPLYALITVAGVAWLLAASVDWQWELPVGTLWLFAAGGAVVGITSRRHDRARRLPFLPWVLAGGALVATILPATVAVSQIRLDQSVRAFRRGDLSAAIKSALAAHDVAPYRAEPFELLAYADLRGGHPALALRAARAAQRRDSRDWEYAYDIVVATAARGRDARRRADDALRLNPHDIRAITLHQRLMQSRGRAKLSRRVAAESALLLPGT